MSRSRAGLLLLVLLTGCTSDPAPPTPAPSPPSVAPGPSETTPVAASRTVDAAGDRLTVTVPALVRDGETVVLTARVRLDRAGAGRSLVTRHFSAAATSFDTPRLVDAAGRRVYPVAPSGRGCACTGPVRLAAGETGELHAAFAGVPASVTRVSVMMPYAGVYADVPVVPGALPGGLTVTGPSEVAGLDAYTERLDGALRTRRTPDRTDLSLDADVLFRVDSAEVTPAAGKAVDAAVAAIEAAGPGPLTVTGHTDDTGSAAHNLTLSKSRADAVAALMGRRLPAAQWPQTVTGRGESEPAVPGTTSAARRLNRRVTITFAADPAKPASPGTTASSTPAPGAPAPSPELPPAAELPPATGVTGSATEGVEVTLPLRRGTVRFTAGEARRVGPFVQVDLIASNTGQDDATILSHLGQSAFTARDEFDPYARYGASGVRLLDGATVAYPVDYPGVRGAYRCLCDRLLNRPITPGTSQVIALWFPAPAAGPVALDVPDAFRLTGIPVR